MHSEISDLLSRSSTVLEVFLTNLQHQNKQMEVMREKSAQDQANGTDFREMKLEYSIRINDL